MRGSISKAFPFLAALDQPEHPKVFDQTFTFFFRYLNDKKIVLPKLSNSGECLYESLSG